MKTLATRIVLTTLTGAMAFLGNSNAADFKNRGEGNASCGSWMQEHQHGSARARMQDQWVLGFVTAEEFVTSSPRYTRDTDNAALLSWISNFCAKSPLDPIVMAAYGLTIELRKDPADIERAKEVIRGVLRNKCEEGDQKSCEILKGDGR
jgi:hypothetical protein